MSGHKPRAPTLVPPAAAWWVQLLFWALVCVTVVMSLLPVEQLPQAAHFWDKAQHALGFAALAFLGLQVGARRPLGTLLALAVLGLGIEWAQSLTGWRQGDWQDWLADVVGLVLGWHGLALSRWLRLRMVELL
jgi:VanZ family protein